MTTERQWDAIHNEGGDGYNPIRAEREEREWREERERVLALRAKPISELTGAEIGEREQMVLRYIESRNLTLEERAEYDALKQRRSDLHAERTGWTVAVTVERRAAWNAQVKAGGISTATYVAAERAQGWTLRELKDAIYAHSL